MGKQILHAHGKDRRKDFRLLTLNERRKTAQKNDENELRKRPGVN